MRHSLTPWLVPFLGYAITAVAWSLSNSSVEDPDYLFDGLAIATIFFYFSYVFVLGLYKEGDGERRSISTAASFAALPYLAIAVSQAVLALLFATTDEKRTPRGMAAAALPVFVFCVIFAVRRSFKKFPPTGGA